LALVVDTGPLLAAGDPDDRDHERCQDLLDSTHEEIVVPAPVVVELEWMTTSRTQPGSFDVFLESVGRGEFRVEPSNAEDYARIRLLLRQYADLPLGLVDASVVAVCERLGERKVATLDHRHFGVIRPAHTRSLRLLPDA
jgi:predicted nucleic acid-binding protein